MTTYALLHTIFFFFVYAFLGWCVEVAYAAITTRELVNRGFLNGPICPIYGCGMTVMIAVLGRFTMPSSDMAWYQNVLVAFFGGMVITTLVELVGGYILYKVFHTRWWDYSMYRFNLGGFICPQFSLLWGLGSVLLMVVVHPLLSKPSAAIPTLVLIWLDVIFGGLFLADLIVSAIQAVGFSKQLARIDELRKAMRTTSDALTEVIGTSAMTMDTLLDEQKLQLTLAAMEGATNAAELRDQLRELAGKAGTLRDTTIRLSKQRFFGTGRLLRAFPDMVPDRREALASLRVGLTKATARAKAAAKQVAEDIAKAAEAAKIPKAAKTAAVKAGVGIEGCMAILVILLPLFLIGEHLIGLIGLLEPLLTGLVAGVQIRVVLLGELPVCFFYLIGRGVLADAQHLVIVSFISHFVFAASAPLCALGCPHLLCDPKNIGLHGVFLFDTRVA